MSNNLEQSKVFNPKVIKRGIVLFVGITVLALVAIFFYKDGVQNLKVWKELDFKYLAVGLIFIIIDLYLGGLRNHLFVREFVSDISQWVSIKANLANIFMGAVTPSQSGGGPAQWYIFHRNGVILADCIGVNFYNWICTLLFFPIAGLISLSILSNSIPDGFIMHLTKFGFSVFTTIFIVIMLGLFAPRVIEITINGIARIIGLIKKDWKKNVTHSGHQGITKLKEYRSKYLGLIKRKPYLMLYSFIITIILYFNKFALAYIFVIAFGSTADFWSVMAVMAIAYLFLYFAPSPGGSGIAELGITALLSPIVGAEFALSITLLHRSFLLFIPAMIGAVVVLRQISQEG